MLTSGSIWAIIWFVLTLALVSWGIWAVRRKKRDRYDDLASIGVFALVIGGIAAIGILIFTFPWLPQYHVMESHTGTVAKVEKRVVTDGNKYANITKEIAFWMDGESEAYITDDVRLTSVNEGQTLTLNRWKHFVYGGQEYWNVLYVSSPKE
ncbi:MAG: hypothetical protein ABIP74_05045 [Candidatus Saccharimonas sp.]